MSSVKPLRISKLENEPPMEASKWLKIQLLVDFSEMVSLLDALGPIGIYITGTVTKKGEESVSKSEFLNKYLYYIESLKKGEIPDETIYKPYFSSIFTIASDLLCIIPMPKDRQLVRVSKPVIQLQAHSLDY